MSKKMSKKQMTPQEMAEKDQDLRVEILDSLMNLMQEHRLAKNMVMWDSTSRLVYEFWQAIAEAQEKIDEEKENESA